MKANRFKALRLSQGLSTRMLAVKANITPAMVIRYETGKVKPSPRVLAKLSEAFKVPVTDLIEKKLLIDSNSKMEISDSDFETYLDQARHLSANDKFVITQIISALTMKKSLYAIAKQ